MQDTLQAFGPEELQHQREECRMQRRDLIECNIIWRGSPILVVKTFGKCNRDQMEIVKLNRHIPEN
jgi:hypothetical protein